MLARADGSNERTRCRLMGPQQKLGTMMQSVAFANIPGEMGRIMTTLIIEGWAHLTLTSHQRGLCVDLSMPLVKDLP